LLVAAVAFLVVIPEGDQLLLLLVAVAVAVAVVVVVALAFLVVIPEGDLLLTFSSAQKKILKIPSKNACQAPNSPKPALIKGIRVAHQFNPIR
jgi:hypothetical protein